MLREPLQEVAAVGRAELARLELEQVVLLGVELPQLSEGQTEVLLLLQPVGLRVGGAPVLAELEVGRPEDLDNPVEAVGLALRDLPGRVPQGEVVL